MKWIRNALLVMVVVGFAASMPVLAPAGEHGGKEHGGKEHGGSEHGGSTHEGSHGHMADKSEGLASHIQLLRTAADALRAGEARPDLADRLNAAADMKAKKLKE